MSSGCARSQVVAALIVEVAILTLVEQGDSRVVTCQVLAGSFMRPSALRSNSAAVSRCAGASAGGRVGQCECIVLYQLCSEARTHVSIVSARGVYCDSGPARSREARTQVSIVLTCSVYRGSGPELRGKPHVVCLWPQGHPQPHQVGCGRFAIRRSTQFQASV